MKEIGQCFKEARESIELSKEEVLRDLNITESQLDNLEDGNANAFKDIFFLKDLIRKYAVYLNLDEDEIMDKFNDFIFGTQLLNNSKSEGLPSVIINSNGRQSPFCSAVVFFMSKLTLFISRVKASPKNVAPDVGTTISGRFISSNGVKTNNSFASISNVIIEIHTLSKAKGSCFNVDNIFCNPLLTD